MMEMRCILRSSPVRGRDGTEFMVIVPCLERVGSLRNMRYLEWYKDDWASMPFLAAERRDASLSAVKVSWALQNDIAFSRCSC